MSMSMLSMLTGGGPLPIPRIPCAVCVAELDRRTVAAPGIAPVDEPAQAATLVGGTLVCEAHAGELLDTFDRGHIAAAVLEVVERLAELGDKLDRLERRASS